MSPAVTHALNQLGVFLDTLQYRGATLDLPSLYSWPWNVKALQHFLGQPHSSEPSEQSLNPSHFLVLKKSSSPLSQNESCFPHVGAQPYILQIAI